LRESLDAQAGIEEQRPEIGRRHQVLKVAVRARDRFQLQLEFAVDRLQFFIDRLQLFLAGFQLLGGRAVFLVNRLQLLVGCTQFLIGGLRFLSGRLQPRLGLLQLFAQPVDDFVACIVLRRLAFHNLFNRAALDEQHYLFSIVVMVVGLDVHQHPMRRAVEANRDGGAKPGLRGFESPVQGRS
jgi:hypothetical protein